VFFFFLFLWHLPAGQMSLWFTHMYANTSNFKKNSGSLQPGKYI